MSHVVLKWHIGWFPFRPVPGTDVIKIQIILIENLFKNKWISGSSAVLIMKETKAGRELETGSNWERTSPLDPGTELKPIENPHRGHP